MDEQLFTEEGDKTVIFDQKADLHKIGDNDKIIGIIAVHKETDRNILKLFCISPTNHSRGIGFDIYHMAEKLYPQVTIWEIETPLFALKNVYLYINKYGY